MVLLLADADLRSLMSVGAAIREVEAAAVAYSDARTESPTRSTVSLRRWRRDGSMLAMPCAVPEMHALGTKVVSSFPGNAARGLSTVSGLYVLNDIESGHVLAVMDATMLTALRTAAASAIAARHLARPNAVTLGVFGTGAQARWHVKAIVSVRPIQRIFVVGSSAVKGARFSRWVGRVTGIRARPVSPEVASSADIVAACTTSPDPVVIGSSVRRGAHVSAIGAFTPTTRELPSELVSAAKVYVDTREGASTEAGDLLIPIKEGVFSLDKIVGELGELAIGRVPSRENAADVTVYKSVGAAFMDAAVARLAYELAVRHGVGSSFDFERGGMGVQTSPKPDS